MDMAQEAVWQRRIFTITTTRFLKERLPAEEEE